MTEFYVLLITVPNLEEGRKIARHLVENKLAACVNIIQNIVSIYEWKDKIEEGSEHLCIVKTTEKSSDKILQKIKEIHSYEVPECIGFKIEKGSESYLKWIEDVIG